MGDSKAPIARYDGRFRERYEQHHQRNKVAGCFAMRGNLRPIIGDETVQLEAALRK